MGFLIGLLHFINIIVALLLVGIVMIQQSKSGGGLGAIAGGMGESVFGAAAGNVITKTTVILCTLFFGITLLLAVLSGRVGQPETLADRLQEGAAPPPVTEVESDDPIVGAEPPDDPALEEAPAPVEERDEAVEITDPERDIQDTPR